MPQIGRKGYLGVKIETTPGTGEAPEKYLPYDSCTLNNVVEVLDDEAAKGIRERAWGSVTARERGEGEIQIKMDVENLPYLLYPALGTKTTTAGAGAGVYEHTFTRKAANPPKTATFTFYDTVETRQFAYGTLNTLEMTFSDEWVNVTGNILSKKPTSSTGSAAITEETVLAFKDANIYFGTDLATAESNYDSSTNATKLSAFTLNINNNAEAHYLSGSTSPDHIAIGQFEAGGNYTLFFEDTTERDAHEAQTQRAMVVSFKGSLIAGSDYEEILIKIPQFHITERSIDTAPAGFVTENPTFVADYNSDAGKSIEIMIRNATPDY
jgi:hypothetical protein